jgi:hypothetical protein
MLPVGCARQFDPSRAIASNPYDVDGDAARVARSARHVASSGRDDVVESVNALATCR